MSIENIDGLTFTFPAHFQTSKYDDWSYYRNQFSRISTGIKAVDLLVIDPTNAAWLVEGKDYRQHQRTKPCELHVEIALKIRDTLSALLPASLNATVDTEKEFAKKILTSHQLRVVLHLEQPAKQSKLFPRAIDPNSVRSKLRQSLKAIDAHCLVVEANNMCNLGWNVN